MSIRIGIGLDVFGAGIDADATTIYNRIIADGGVSNLTRLNFFVKGLKAIYGDLANVPVCYDAHWIGYKLGSGTGATAGQAVAKLYSLQGNIQGDAPNKYWVGSGVTNNFCQSNTSTYNTNDIDIEVKAFTSATTGDINFINISNGTSTTVDFFYSKSSNAIAFQYYTSGFRSAFSVTTITDGDVFRVTRNSTTGAVVFKKNGTTITTSGSQVAGALDFSNTTIKIGQGLCKIYYANFYISGVLNKEFNPNLYTGANTWTSSTSEIWTINSTGAGLADAVQSTAASQPLLLSHNGASTDNYAWFPAVNGNYCSTPSSTANRITGDIEMIAYIDPLTLSGSQTIIGKWGDCYVFKINSAALYFQYYNSGSTLRSHTSTNTIALGAKWVRVTRNNTTGEVKFYTSSDAVTTSILSITWTQLGTTISGTVESIQLTTQIVTIGTENDGATNKFSGKIYRATISNSIGGAPVVDFNPATYNASTSQTAWTSATGEIWTISTGTATTGYKGQLVSKTIVMSDGVDDFISVTGMTSRQYFTRYVACIPYTNPNTAPRIISGNADTHLIFKTGAGAFEAFNGAQLAFTGEVVNILQALIVDYNSTNSKTFVNNANETSGNTGTTSSTAISLFGSVTGTTLSNAVINTVIQSIAVDNATNRTATYNLIRSLNNNAF